MAPVAAPVVNAPSAGANAAAGAGASQATGQATQTDDQILDSVDFGDEGTDDGDGDQTGDEGLGADGTETEGEGEGQGQDDADADADGTDKDELDLDALLTTAQPPPELKALFKDPKVGGLLKTQFYTLAAFRENFATVAEAKQMRELFPTMDDAKQTVQYRADLEHMDGLFYSDDPTDHQGFITSLHEEDPKAFTNIAKAFPEVLAQVAPELYRADTLERAGHVIQHIFERAGNDTNLKNACDVLAHKLFGKVAKDLGQEARRPDPREAHLDRRSRELNAQEKRIESGKFQSFFETVNDSAYDRIGASVKTTVANVLKASNAKLTPKATDRIIGDVIGDINKALEANRELRATTRRMFTEARKAGYGSDANKRIVDLLANRANLLIKSSVAKRVNEWTKDVLGQQAARVSDRQRAGNRVDIAGGGSPQGANRGAGRGPVSTDDIDYSKTSDDDIMNGKVTRRAR